MWRLKSKHSKHTDPLIKDIAEIVSWHFQNLLNFTTLNKTIANMQS